MPGVPLREGVNGEFCDRVVTPRGLNMVVNFYLAFSLDVNRQSPSPLSLSARAKEHPKLPSGFDLCARQQDFVNMR